MHELVAAPPIPAMNEYALGRVRELEAELQKLPQVPVKMHHVLHGRMYARTCYIPEGIVVSCCLIKVPTIVVLAGSADVYVGKDKPLHLEGYSVIPGSAGRKQVFVSLTDFALTMLYATNASTIEDAEAEITDEIELLASRRDNLNTVVITGE